MKSFNQFSLAVSGSKSETHLISKNRIFDDTIVTWRDDNVFSFFLDDLFVVAADENLRTLLQSSHI